MKRLLLPLGVLGTFAALVGLLWVGLQRDPRLVPSPLVGKPAPEFTLSRLRDPGATLSRSDLLGKASLLNVWATWCVSCRHEHGLLMKIAEGGVSIYGLNYKDDRADAVRWLDRLGDPYVANAFDPDGRLGLDLGVYGTPETFLIAADGTVAYKHVGPITLQVWNDTLLPMLRESRKVRG